MNYLIIEDNVISNIIVADEEFAASIKAKPYYAGAVIGAAYDPPAEIDPVTQTQLALAELAETESAHDLENKLALAELAETIGGTTNG